MKHVRHVPGVADLGRVATCSCGYWGPQRETEAERQADADAHQEHWMYEQRIAIREAKIALQDEERAKREAAQQKAGGE